MRWTLYTLSYGPIPSRRLRGQYPKGLQVLPRTSRMDDAPAQGLCVRRDEGGRLGARAKLVRAEFTQAIEEHWSRQALEANRLASGAT